MKQEIISFLSTCQDDIKKLAVYLYENPEISYNEYNSSKYICDMLKRYNFNITEKFLDIDNAFYAQKGSGYPKICFLCEYAAIEEEGHITGHNLVTTISVAAAITLGSIIDKGHNSITIMCKNEKSICFSSIRLYGFIKDLFINFYIKYCIKLSF